MMQAIVVVTATIYYALRHRTGLWRPVLVVAGVIAMGLAAGAVQLLPSAEYSAQAVRFVTGTSLPAAQKIPIAYLIDSILPRTLLSYLFSWNFQGMLGPGEVLSPYFGVFPLLLAVVGLWKCRMSFPWVRYSAGLAAAAFLFSLGASSLLYGLIYALVPFLWMAREASRFLYMAHFGLVILAAYGAQTLFGGDEPLVSWRPLNRILLLLAIASAMVLAVPLVFGKLELKPWTTSGRCYSSSSLIRCSAISQREGRVPRAASWWLRSSFSICIRSPSSLRTRLRPRVGARNSSRAWSACAQRRTF